MRGKFITIHGASNIGKSTQMELLAQRLIKEKLQNFLCIKFPMYCITPTGPEIFKILRYKTTQIDAKGIEMQKLGAQNRRDFQDTLVAALSCGLNVIAEDYKGTGIAWGLTNDLPLEELEKVNADLLEPDLSILLDGKRFISGMEKNHIIETAGETVWKKNKEMHLFLAKRYGWKIVNASQSKQKVHEDIWKHVGKTIKKQK